MKMRNKGKVYPSPSMSSNPPPNRDTLSILKLLPAAILALMSALSFEDREVLAYLVTRSIKSVNPSSIVDEKKNKNSKKSAAGLHKPPVFDCECFDCYTSYWFRWDSSPNRELIHQAIEAFEEHLFSEEQLKKTGKGKKKERIGRRGPDKPAEEREMDFPEVEGSFVVVMPENEESPPVEFPVKDEATVLVSGIEEEEEDPPEAEAAANNNKGFVRKVFPDVVGILNSRLWSLWGPSV